MNAIEALKSARAAGVHIAIDGADLLLEAAAEPPQAVLDALARHKPEILAALRQRAVVAWLNQHPEPSPPGRCAWCSAPEVTDSPDAVVLPFGTELGTHVWLHAQCWPAWWQKRIAAAQAAIEATAPPAQ